MKKLSAKEYLLQLWNLDREISVKYQELERLRNQIGVKPQADPDKTPGARFGKISDPVSEIAIKIVKMESQLNRKIDRMIDLKQKITLQIDGLDNRTYRNILVCRYVLMQNWEQVAESVGYERRQCIRIHGRALQEFGRKYLKCH